MRRGGPTRYGLDSLSLWLAWLSVGALSACEGASADAGAAASPAGQATQSSGVAHDTAARAENPADPTRTLVQTAPSTVQVPASFEVESVQGQVRSRDLSAGQLVLTTSHGDLALNARPSDIIQLQPGDTARFELQRHEGMLWISTGTEDHPRAKREANVLLGSISEIDKRNGRISIGGRPLRAHPSQLEALIPGQFVTLEYAYVDGEAWMTSARVRGTTNGIWAEGTGDDEPAATADDEPDGQAPTTASHAREPNPADEPTRVSDPR